MLIHDSVDDDDDHHLSFLLYVTVSEAHTVCIFLPSCICLIYPFPDTPRSFYCSVVAHSRQPYQRPPLLPLLPDPHADVNRDGEVDLSLSLSLRTSLLLPRPWSRASLIARLISSSSSSSST